MRSSSVGGGRILRCTLSVRLSVCLSVCPSVPLWSVTSRHLANYNDTLRAAYRTAISVAQTCFKNKKLKQETKKKINEIKKERLRLDE